MLYVFGTAKRPHWIPWVWSMPQAMKIFIVTACICMSEDNGIPKRTKRAAGTSSREMNPAMSTGTFEGFYIRETFCKINIVGQSSPLGLGQATRVLSGFFSRMLPLFARCIIVKMSNHFLRTQGERRPARCRTTRFPASRVLDLKELFAILDHGQTTENYPSKIADQLHYSWLTNEFSNAAPLRVGSHTKKKTNHAFHSVNAKFRLALSYSF